MGGDTRNKSFHKIPAGASPEVFALLRTGARASKLREIHGKLRRPKYLTS